MNILNAIREQLSPELLGQVSQRVGESPEAAKAAVDHSLTALLGSAAAKASSPEGAAGLFNLLKEKTPSGGWPGSIVGWLGNLSGDGAGIGSSLVSLLLGSKANMIGDFIARRSGVRSESATTILGTAGTFLMGVFGKRVATDGLSAAGFGQLLRSQIPHLQGNLSSDLTSLLGVGNLFNAAKPTQPPAPYANQIQRNQPAETVTHAGGIPGNRVLRFALIPVALLIGLLFLANRRSRTASVGGTSDESYTAGRAALSGASNYVESLSVDVIQLADRLKEAIAVGDGTPVDLKGLNFDDSGNAMASAKSTVSALGKLMSDNPSVRSVITVYGKTAEDAASKANSVKAALLRMGIIRERIVMQPEIGESTAKVSFSK